MNLPRADSIYGRVIRSSYHMYGALLYVDGVSIELAVSPPAVADGVGRTK